MSQPGVSSSWATLQSAAFQVAEEEKSTSYEGLLFVADQIATEQGFPSPYKRKKEKDHNNSTAPTSSLEARKVSPRLTNPEQTVTATNIALKANKTESDADALLKEMKFTPRAAATGSTAVASSTVTFDDRDLEALIKMSQDHQSEEDQYRRHHNVRPSTAGNNSIDSNRNRRSRDRYLSRLSNHNNRQPPSNTSSVAFTNNSSRIASVSSHPSALARALQAMDRRDPNALKEKLKLTDLQASLLLTMQQLQSSSSQYSHSHKAQSKSTRSSLSSVGSRREAKDGHSGHSGHHNNNMERIEQLSLPRPIGPSAMDLKYDPSLRHGLFEEAEHCTFKPCLAAGSKGNNQHHHNKASKKSSSKHNNNNNDSDNDDNDSDLSPAQIKEKERRRLELFLLRQEGDERARRESLQHEQGRLNFESQLDRKQCPGCGAKQSYDEYKEKRKLCPACELEYKPALTWGSIASSFLRKVKHCEHDKQRRLEQLRQKLIASSQPFANSSDDKNKRKMAREQLEEFLSRLDEAMARRDMRVQQIAAEASRENTFQPNARSEEQRAKDKANRKRNGGGGGGMMGDSDDDEDNMSTLSVDPVRDFLLRYEEDMARRKENMPQRFGERHEHKKQQHADGTAATTASGRRRFKF